MRQVSRGREAGAVPDGFVHALDGFEAVAAGVPAGAWDAPSPWGGQMPLGEFVERYPLEIVVHAWDLAQARDQAVLLDPGLVRGALVTARQFAAAGRAAGLAGPGCAVADDAGGLPRLLAISGRDVSQV